MNLDFFKSKREENNIKNNNISDFLKDLSNAFNSNRNEIDNFKKQVEKVNSEITQNNEIKDVQNGDICVVYGIQDEKVTLINTRNGKEFDIDVLDNAKNNGTCIIEKKDLYNLDLGSKLIMRDEKYEIYDGKININDEEAKYKLEELYSALKEDENKRFIIENITEDKIYLTYEDGGGYFTIYKELYPNFEIGNIVKKENGKYTKVE